MVKLTIEVEGMGCGMCESHVNDVVRRVGGVKKVTSSHTKGITEVIADDGVDGEAIKKAIQKQGYNVGGMHSAPYEKKGLFSFLKK